MSGTSDSLPENSIAAKSIPTEFWHQLSGEETLIRKRVTPAGLSSAEAAARLQATGPNALREVATGGLRRILLRQFRSVIVWILIAAGCISTLLGDWVDASAIFVIVALNAIIAFQQEYHAERSMAALRKMTAPQTKARRDGVVVSIPAADIVPGDILLLEAGDLIAADARLLRAASVRCVESALTGEAAAVVKSAEALGLGHLSIGDRSNMIFMGTSLVAGTAEAVVVETGMTSELGRIAHLLVQTTNSHITPLQIKLDSFGRVLGWVALGVVALLFCLGLARGTPAVDMFMTSISLAVAAVPEGLPAVVTVSLALGVRRMAGRRALVRRLSAVETLGSTSVICTDKTGTLTGGTMTARHMYVAGEDYEITGEGYGPSGEIRLSGRIAVDNNDAKLLEMATVLLGCNNASVFQEQGVWKVIGDPTEGALLVAGTKAGGSRENIDRELPRQYEIPFDTDRKQSTVLRRTPGGTLRAFTNGAPGSVLSNCARFYTGTGISVLTITDRERILGAAESMARRGLRVLASAWGEIVESYPADFSAESVERDLVFVGLTGIYDPPRPEAKEAILKCQVAGIRVIMITGDHSQTAVAIARELGISKAGFVITGTDLDRISELDLKRYVSEVDIYARVTAGHKLRIVQALKANDAVVAMTGDGVNDAPAIKGADIGVSMGGTGTEVTKQASDIIITDDNFATIVDAVEEGRGIYSNIRKTLQYLLAGNIAELLLVTICVVIGLPSPLLPVHLLWINLVTDGLPALCLAADPIEPGVMGSPPRRPSEPIMDGQFLRTMLLTAGLTAATAVAVYSHMLRSGTLEAARTHAFTVLVFAELLRALGARSENKPVWRIPVLTNVSLAVIIAVSFCLQIWILNNSTLNHFLRTEALPWTNVCVLLGLGTVPLLGLELMKVLRSRADAIKIGGV